jgi:hypothetical protein
MIYSNTIVIPQDKINKCMPRRSRTQTNDFFVTLIFYMYIFKEYVANDF